MQKSEINANHYFTRSSECKKGSLLKNQRKFHYIQIVVYNTTIIGMLRFISKMYNPRIYIICKIHKFVGQT